MSVTNVVVERVTGRWHLRLKGFSRSTLGRLLRLKLSAFAITVLLIIVIGAVMADVLAPYDPSSLVTAATEAPSSRHFLGTDQLGRDQLSRLLFGARASLQVATLSTVIGASIGITIGLVAANAGGIVESILMRTMDAQLALPGLILPLLLLTALGGGITTVSLALGISLVPALARITRGQTIAEMPRDYVLAATSTGAGRSRILFRHVLPNTLPPITVASSLAMSRAVLTEAALSFLGVGVTPPTTTWGTMLSTGFSFMDVAPWIAFVPGFAIFVLVLSFNFLGDGLRDVLDPRLRGKL